MSNESNQAQRVDLANVIIKSTINVHYRGPNAHLHKKSKWAIVVDGRHVCLDDDNELGITAVNAAAGIEIEIGNHAVDFDGKPESTFHVTLDGNGQVSESKGWKRDSPSSFETSLGPHEESSALEYDPEPGDLLTINTSDGDPKFRIRFVPPEHESGNGS